jgi:hypothetical protein
MNVLPVVDFLNDFYNFSILGILPASYNPTSYFAQLNDLESSDDDSVPTPAITLERKCVP